MAWSSTVHPRFPELRDKFGNEQDPLEDESLTAC